MLGDGVCAEYIRSIRRFLSGEFKFLNSFDNRDIAIDGNVVENLMFARWPAYRQFINRPGRADTNVQTSRALPHESIRRKMIADDRPVARFNGYPGTDS